MRNFILYIGFIFLTISCSKQSKLSETFNCGTVKIENTKTITDFNKNFNIHIPSSWKTKLYFNKYESEIFDYRLDFNNIIYFLYYGLSSISLIIILNYYLI